MMNGDTGAVSDNQADSSSRSVRCSLSILVARTDVAFIRQTIPHLVRSCAFPFVERALVVDTAPLSPTYAKRPNVGSASELQEMCEEMIAQGWIDRLHFIDYAAEKRREVNERYFGRDLRETHDFRGYPIYGSLFALDAAPTDLVVHFDSDMLLHQDPTWSWIVRGAELLESCQDVIFVAPLSGPPRDDGVLFQGDTAYTLDQAGFYRFSFFTSRKFLVDRQRLRAAGPIPPWWISDKRRMVSWITRKSALWSFEMMASRWMKEKNFCRADLCDGRAWTLHTPDHGPKFLARLEAVVARVESGDFPPSQSGHFDLNLDAWD